MKLKFLILTLFLAIMFALNHKTVLACSCAGKPTVLDNYENSELVLIARVASVAKTPAAANQQTNYPNDIRSLTVVVEKVYKGKTRVRSELTLKQGTGADCVRIFSEQDAGEKYLFYLRGAGEAEVWSASECGRTNRLEDAREDLLYLDNIEKLRGKTRISGHYYLTARSTFTVANRTILIRGEKETYETKTDERGIFEIYDVPPGEYVLEPELPGGWRLRFNHQPGEPDNSMPFTLKAKKHIALDLFFQPDTAVEGTIVGPDGNPLKGICAHLIRPKSMEIDGALSCTGPDGRFRFESIQPASYILLVNQDSRISPREPYPPLFYPNATKMEDATPIVVNEGEKIQGLNLVIPKLVETINVVGVVKFSDDNPAGDRPVRFTSFVRNGYDGDQMVMADSNGRFKLKLLKDLKGELNAEFFARRGMYENCPKMDALFKEGEVGFEMLKTQPIVIEADKDIDYIELRFPFPKCGR